MCAAARTRTMTPAAMNTVSAAPLKVSACLVVRNEESVIRRCLTSLQGVADEIILVHDGPCDDATVDIAKELGCQVFVCDAVGNPEHHTVFAYERARGTWLLTLDADEFLSSELAAVIPELTARTDYDGWEFQWPMWDGECYITESGPYKLSLFRRSKTSLVGLLQSAEQVDGPVGRRQEILHHQPQYNNFTLRSVVRKWRHWCRVQARELTSPYSELPKFNYAGPDRWPRQRYVFNALSPVLAVPNGMAHSFLAYSASRREGHDTSARLVIYAGIYATLLQIYVARRLYLERPIEMTRRWLGRRRAS
jgi:glycosyltransferase involved in cell wall biosynthesis